MINNYHNYMTYFFRIFILDASDRLFTYFISTGFLHFSYVIIAAFCQLCLINILLLAYSTYFLRNWMLLTILRQNETLTMLNIWAD